MITDFYKKFTIPKNRIPRQDEDDEIIVASSSSSQINTRDRAHEPATQQARQPLENRSQDGSNKVKRGRGRPPKTDSASPSKLRFSTPLLDQEESGRSTPTRRSPRKLMAGINGSQDAPPHSSGVTSIASSLKTSPTKVRVLEAVEIPSPSRHSSPFMPPPSQKPAAEPRNAANTSFSSFSTLTSLSGMSSQSSSRRIVKNGVQAVTNSDSASMSSSSSDDELVDLDSFAPRKKRRLTPPAVDANNGLHATKPTRSSARVSGEHAKKRAEESWRPRSPLRTAKYKHSLFSMVKQSAREAASEANIAQAEAEMLEQERLERQRGNALENTIETKSMAKEFAQDSDEEERMLMAMERTEVLKGEETFHFFLNETQNWTDTVFPTSGLEKYGLDFLRDESKRQHACTSGFLALVASQQGLPEPLVIWMHNKIFSETSEQLCESTQVKRYADAEESMTIEDGSFVPRSLKYTLKTMAVLAPHTSLVDQACALAELILLNNDENVRGNMDIQSSIEHSMHAILASNASDESLQAVYRETTRQTLHASSISRHLLSRAIVSIPATTSALQQLRRKLSLHILLDASIDEDIDVTSPSTGVRLLLRMKRHDSFSITETTNYTLLHSLIDLVDIAIDVGFSDLSFLNQNDQTSDQNGLRAKSVFGHAITAQSPAEKSFNAQIDDIVSHLRSMCSKIRDAGTSHLKRTEAKSALERLIVRLDYAVRTKPRPRKGVFDRAGAGAGAMDGFLRH
ncbi:hypothetical protein E2P81_ATG10261, partial [Venturia nashicola]